MITFLVWILGCVGIGYLGAEFDLNYFVIFILGFCWGGLVVEGHKIIVNRHNRNLE
jgi:hypothetical protein